MTDHATPILPVTIGAEADAVAASSELAERRPLGAGDPPADRRAGDVAPPDHFVGGTLGRRRLEVGRGAGRTRRDRAISGSSPVARGHRARRPSGGSWRGAPCVLSTSSWSAAREPRWARPGCRAPCWASSAGAATRSPRASRPNRSISTPKVYALEARPTPNGSAPRPESPPTSVCPTWRSYHLAMAPPMAARGTRTPRIHRCRPRRRARLAGRAGHARTGGDRWWSAVTAGRRR